MLEILNKMFETEPERSTIVLKEKSFDGCIRLFILYVKIKITQYVVEKSCGVVKEVPYA